MSITLKLKHPCNRNDLSCCSSLVDHFSTISISPDYMSGLDQWSKTWHSWTTEKSCWRCLGEPSTNVSIHFHILRCKHIVRLHIFLVLRNWQLSNIYVSKLKILAFSCHSQVDNLMVMIWSYQLFNTLHSDRQSKKDKKRQDEPHGRRCKYLYVRISIH